MSKELEALKLLKPKDEDCYEVSLPDSNEIAYEYLLKYLTPPTADEVCEVLTAHYKKEVLYDNRKYLYCDHAFYFEDSTLIIVDFRNRVVNFANGEYHKTNNLTPHLINLISRFYMGVE
jgi:hypothetical protein